jgi:hypothetical protein
MEVALTSFHFDTVAAGWYAHNHGPLILKPDKNLNFTPESLRAKP